MTEWAAVTQLLHDRLNEAIAVEPLAVGDRGEQVPGGDGVVLADAVAAVLGLVVHRRGPLELQERDVGRARERDPLRGDARRADDQLRRVAVLLEAAHRRL